MTDRNRQTKIGKSRPDVDGGSFCRCSVTFWLNFQRTFPACFACFNASSGHFLSPVNHLKAGFYWWSDIVGVFSTDCGFGTFHRPVTDPLKRQPSLTALEHSRKKTNKFYSFKINLNEQICGFSHFDVTGVVEEMGHLTAELTSGLCGTCCGTRQDTNSSYIAAIRSAGQEI